MAISSLRIAAAPLRSLPGPVHELKKRRQKPKLAKTVIV
jgi:hypothetical protein